MCDVEPNAELPRLIARANAGDAAAVDELYALTYQELRGLAQARLRASGRDAVLDTTELVHESYLRLAGGRSLPVNDRLHFLRYAGRAMRSVIVDHVRERQAARRGGAAEHVPLSTMMGEGEAASEEHILRVHEALEELATLDARLARVVEMRYFAGMTESEIARVLDVTERTVRRDWQKARLLLARALA